MCLSPVCLCLDRWSNATHLGCWLYFACSCLLGRANLCFACAFLGSALNLGFADRLCFGSAFLCGALKLGFACAFFCAGNLGFACTFLLGFLFFFDFFQEVLQVFDLFLWWFLG